MSLQGAIALVLLGVAAMLGASFWIAAKWR